MPAHADPVPFLTAEQTLTTFKLPEGFRIEVVAEEPMVQHPIAMQFDADGRIWVVEMRAYMPDIDANNEKNPIGRISILEDTDGDGHMNKKTIFMDGLVLPRAIGLVRDGALVAIPPNVFFCCDTNGDGQADERTPLVDDYGIRGNPEHQPNGLMSSLDNWIYNANYDKRFRFDNGKWIVDQVNDVGQYGITQDNYGRRYTNTNSDQLRVNLIPEHYADRNPHYRAGGINVQTALDQYCWPSHNTAINRPLMKGMLDFRGRLSHFTGCCSPVIYRGGIFPDGFEGNAFICEPVANFIRRDVLSENDATVSAQNPYERDEFLTSTYERFRPVNLYNGPDGALYIVDIHHGLIQHKTYETPEVIADYRARELDKYLGTGRIYRVLPTSATLYPKPKMSHASSAELVGFLSHPSGWWRDTAQRLLVERNDFKSAHALTKLAANGENPLGRLHALWTLEGMHRLDAAILTTALADKDSHIRAAAIRMCEPMLFSKDASPRVLPQVLNLAGDSEPHVRLQFVLTVGQLGTPQTDGLIANILREGADKPLLLDAAVSGMRGREVIFLESILGQIGWTQSRGHAATFTALSKCVLAEANSRRVARLLELIAAQPADQVWRQTAMLDAFPAPTATTQPARRGIMLPSEPPALAILKKASPAVRGKLANVTAILHWPRQPGYIPPPPVKPLTPEEQTRFAAGKVLYTSICIQCHKADGMGQAGLAPPLVDSEWVLGSESRMARIVINGLHGPVTVDGTSFNLDMPGLSALSDDQIAAAMTYVRREWDNGASPVKPSKVKEVRARIGVRTQSWSERELLKINED